MHTQPFHFCVINFDIRNTQQKSFSNYFFFMESIQSEYVQLYISLWQYCIYYSKVIHPRTTFQYIECTLVSDISSLSLICIILAIFAEKEQYCLNSILKSVDTYRITTCSMMGVAMTMNIRQQKSYVRYFSRSRECSCDT